MTGGGGVPDRECVVLETSNAVGPAADSRKHYIPNYIATHWHSWALTGWLPYSKGSHAQIGSTGKSRCACLIRLLKTNITSGEVS